MAWVEPRGAGFLVRWREGGKKQHRWSSSEKEAFELKARVERGLSLGHRDNRGRVRYVPFGDYARRVLQLIDSEQTRYHYQCAARVHLLPLLAERSLAEVTSDELRDLLAGLRDAGLGGHQRYRVWGVLSKVFRTALREGLIEENPLAAVSPPHREPSRVEPLTPAQIDTLAEAAPPHYRTPVLVGAYAGLRVGEVGALRREAVDLIGREIRVVAGVALAGGRCWISEPKTRASRRSVPVPSFLAEEIGGHIERFGLSEDGRVFSSKFGGLLTGHLMSQALREVRRRAGLPGVTFHTLRHTYASLLIREGAHPKVIQTLLGHSSIRTTLDLYGHLFPGMGREMADRLNALRMGAM